MAFGFGELSPEELSLLHRIADVDGDGMISLSDFRSVLDSTRSHPSRNEAVMTKIDEASSHVSGGTTGVKEETSIKSLEDVSTFLGMKKEKDQKRFTENACNTDMGEPETL